MLRGRRARVYLLMVVSLYACNQRGETEEILNSFIGTEVILPSQLIYHNLPEDMSKIDFYNSKYKTIFYIDSINCFDCSVNRLLILNEYFIEYNRVNSVVMVIVSSNVKYEVYPREV